MTDELRSVIDNTLGTDEHLFPLGEGEIPPQDFLDRARASYGDEQYEKLGIDYFTQLYRYIVVMREIGEVGMNALANLLQGDDDGE